MRTSAAAIGDVRVAAYVVPTDAPESDGTLEWGATTLVVVEIDAGGARGSRYTYADTGTAARDRCGRRALRRCQRRVFAQAGARASGRLRRGRRHVVRGARQLGRSRGPPRPSRSRARADGHRRRRIRLRSVVFPEDARGGG